MEDAGSPGRGLDDSVGSAANDPDMGHGLLQREVSRLEKEVASLKTKLRNAQDQIVELEKVRAPCAPACVCACALAPSSRAAATGKRGTVRADQSGGVREQHDAAAQLPALAH